MNPILNPYNFANLTKEQQAATLRAMTPAQRLTLYRNFKLVIHQTMNGLGELNSWLSDAFHSVESIIPAASTVLNFVAPGAGTAINMAAAALFPNQRQVTGAAAAVMPGGTVGPPAPTSRSSSSSYMPLILGGAALLLFAGKRR